MATKNTVPQLPKFDMEAYLALQRANVETIIATQKIFYDFSQAVVKRQSELLSEMFNKTETIVKGYDAKKQPHVFVDEAKAAVEKAMADAKETMDLGVKAQTEVVDLIVRRASANFDEVNKTLAA